MERKIGEIFEYNGEWYQCVVAIDGCRECSFRAQDYCTRHSECLSDARRDGISVIFNKLKKLGEPYMSDGHLMQTLSGYKQPIYLQEKGRECYFSGCYLRVEIKQNKEDMEENKTTFPKEDNALTRTVYAYVNGKISDKELIKSIKEMSDEYPYNKNNLKPFSLELVKQGKPVCTRDGRKARIICFDAKDTQPIIGLYEKNIDGIVREYLCSYHTDGRMYDDQDTGYDLMMLPEKKEGWINIYNADTTFYYVDGRVFETKDKAVQEDKEEVEKEQREKNEYIDTIRVEWEE